MKRDDFDPSPCDWAKTYAHTRRSRGRPAIVHDNCRVQAFLRKFDSTTDLVEELPSVVDALTGLTYLQTGGSTRPLSMRMLLRVLYECSQISAEAAAVALGRNYSTGSVGRYTALARVASKEIARLLDTHPAWEEHAGMVKACRMELDGPSFAELSALGLM